MVKCFRISHFDGAEKLLFEGYPTDDIDDRCQRYSDRSGYIVRLVCPDPHRIKKFQPKVLRVDPISPPRPDVPVERHLEKLAWQSLRQNSGMFLDDRMRQTRRGRRMNRNKVVAYLNHSAEGFYVKIRLPEKFGLKQPIPRSIGTVSGAVEWVFRNAYWK